MRKKIEAALLQFAINIMSRNGMVGANTINATYDRIEELRQ